VGVDRRYSDEDVRRNPGVAFAAAERYLEGYTGEFDFLLGMQMRVSEGLDLTTGMVRGVLNCMRNDPRCGALPDLEATSEDEDPPEAPVLALVPDPLPCPYEGTEHSIHWYEDGRSNNSQTHCAGWHAINRRLTERRVRFHRDYVRGANSNVIHRCTHEGFITWFPPFHSWGMARASIWTVGRGCTPNAFPLKRATTLTAAEVREQEPYDGAPGDAVRLCRQCFPGTNDERVGR
jgi:hypothetical protein